MREKAFYAANLLNVPLKRAYTPIAQKKSMAYFKIQPLALTFAARN
jgi:hypothetical protein